MNLLIRAMAAHDLDRVLEMVSGSVEAPRWTPGDYEQVMQAAPDLPSAPPSDSTMLRCALVAVLSDKVVGFAVAGWLREEAAAELEGLLVDADQRRRGIGSALVEACMAWASDAGASMIRLEVRASNAAALALYRRLGFFVEGVRRGYYSAPLEDALLLQAPLTPVPL
jgi:[ribosomal protein S18]-alanine N-acetyltransferase